MAKLGFGYAYSKASLGPTVADILVGVNVPMGPVEIGATYAQETVSGIADVPAAALGGFKPVLVAADGVATGWSLGAKYNLSKRTSLKLNFAAWTRSGYEQFEAFGANLASAQTLAAQATAAGTAAAAAAAAAIAAGNAAGAAAAAQAAAAPFAAQATAASAAAQAQIGYSAIETQANLLLTHSF